MDTLGCWVWLASAAAVLFLAVSLKAVDGNAETLKFPAVMDVSLSAHPDERDLNMGAAERLKLKYLEEMGLVAFDLGRLGGKRVTWARLYFHCDGENTKAEMERLGLPGELVMPLRYVGVSTVSGHWSESGATFNEAVKGSKPWSWRGSRFWDVIFGCGNSVYSSREIEKLEDYWWRVEVAPEVINALVAGGGYGLCVSEESNAPWELAPNNYLHTRESGAFAPYLVVETEPASAPAAAAQDLAVSTAPQWSTLDHGAIELSLAVPEGALVYKVEVDGRRLEPWMVERPGRPGERQRLVIRDLPAGREIEVSLTVVGAGGLVSASVTRRVTTSEALARPALDAAAFAPRVGRPAGPAGDTRMGVWAYSEGVKVDPVTGEFAGGASPGETRSFNSVWDASEGNVALVAARGEIAAFQVAVEASAGPLEDVTVALGDLTGGHASIGASGIRIYREWYVKPHRAWVADYAIPLDAAIPIPYPPNGVTGQRVQSFWIDIHVPKAAAPGTYTGALTVSAAGVADAVLEVEIEVFGAALPDEMTFWAEFNGYGAPGGAGTPYYYDAHRLAHYNRCCINIVPYDQGPDGDQEYRPQIEGTGAATRVVDWSEFDAVQGPLLDGSAFAGLPRDGVALRVFYLPFYEYWPAPFLENYDWGQPPSAETLNLNYLCAPPIEEAVSEDFKAAWRSVVPEFVDHFRAKGWTHTIFECYTNNKWHMAGTMFWNLDEPAVREDYRAIRFFGRLFKDALGDPGEIQMLFRGDISRPQWQFDDFNGVMDIEYVNMGVVDMVRSVQEANRRAGSRFVVYGHANEITRSNFETVQWCLTSYLCGADGVLPWNSFDATDAFTRGSRNGLIIDGAPAGHRGPVASLRVFAFRRGVQDVEILKLLAAKKGWTTDQMAVFINAFVPLGSDFTQAFTDEAAAATYEAAGAAGFVALRKAALDAL